MQGWWACRWRSYQIVEECFVIERCGVKRCGAVLLAVLLTVPVGVGAQEAPVVAADRVAVVPFDNISGSAEDAWLGAGIAETVTAGRRGSGVSLGSVTRVVDAGAGEQLGARWGVSGSYKRLGDQLRVTARVRDVSTGMVVGAVTVDGALAGFFALQDRVVEALVPVLAGLVPDGRGRDEARAPAAEAPTPEAPARAARERRPPPARPGPPAPPAAAPERMVLAPGVIDGPPPPVAPAVINRDAEGRATIRATRLTEALTQDGQHDESVYATVPAISDFIQQAPDEGADRALSTWPALACCVGKGGGQHRLK